ncbi:MAG: hypothetical protein P4L62_00950 [Candidatus Pacebacteria bacterium]|nr:hypothetical protein [Candidatus Paceibacterota bacterium]MDR3582916.1 hypothetical protein [Candidatus Paceibacterota bacterium]
MHKIKSGEWLIWLSVLAVVLAAIDFMTKGNILNLAGTQWILIAIVLGIYSLYLKDKVV